MIARERNNQRLGDQNFMLETEVADRWSYEGCVELASAQSSELRRYGHCLDLSLDLLSLRDQLTDRGRDSRMVHAVPDADSEPMRVRAAQSARDHRCAVRPRQEFARLL
jgi:hypothetical protein